MRIAERAAQVIGFAALDVEAKPPELVALFVEPTAMRTGAGRALLRAALAEARARGIAELVIESDPDAEAFYLAQGAERVGERIAASTGRSLPLLKLLTARGS